MLFAEVLIDDFTGYFAVLEDNEYLMKLPASIRSSSDLYAVSLEGTSFSQQAKADGTMYAGIIANTKNKEQAVRYIRYLLS